MRILLVGEYSNLHNSLKDGLEQLGHEVTLLGTGDAFKKIPVDINVRGRFLQDRFLPNAFRQLIYRFTRNDIALFETYMRARSALNKLGDFEVIQLINEYPFKTPYYLERMLVSKLRKMTKRLVVLGCGDDYTYLSNRHKLPYHPMDLLQGKQQFLWSEKYLTKKHQRYHQWIFQLKDLVITTDLDYHTIYKEENRSDYFGMIPNPINLDRLKDMDFPSINGEITIFHGINRSNYFKKGNDLFESALNQINDEFSDRVNIITAESLPYATYIERYNEAHILLDQTYALDQGYNALEAMAKGKVVFTGAGSQFCDFYNLPKNRVAIHTTPSIENIIEDLQALLENPNKLVEISKNAREFIAKQHNYIEIAKRYVSAWDTLVED